ncbi:hypothetical protein [Sphingobacterium siyangense]|uniref:hypothetical protein n=1 Tax=Sphingobacterium siyangense TaxID=459529 RepID=UPI0028ADF61D|nr:hypothetical protein [Sphingobacterium siyangense]
MRTKIKLDFKSLEKELDILTNQKLTTILGGVMSAAEKVSYVGFYESMRDTQEWSMLMEFDLKYPGNINETKEEKLAYLKKYEDPNSSLGRTYKSYAVSVDLVSRAKKFVAPQPMSNLEQDQEQKKMQEDAGSMFNEVNIGTNGSTALGTKYLIVRSAEELRNYFRAKGMQIDVQTNMVGAQEVITNLILPTKKQGNHDPNTTDGLLTSFYNGYGVQDVTTDISVDKGRYTNQNASVKLYQVDIVGLSNFLNANDFDSLYNELYMMPGSTTDGTTSDDMSSVSVPVTNPGTTYFGNPH